MLVALAELRLEKREPLREDDVLVVEPRDDRRVVEKNEDHEQDRDGEQHRGRVAAYAEPPGDRVQAAAPGRQDEQNDARQEPEERVTLAQAARADQLEDDDEQGEGCERRRD